MKPMKVGVVGLGMVAQIMHLPYLKETPGVEVAAVCDVSKKLTARAAAHFGVPHAFTDYKEMLKRADIDAVFVLTFLHGDITLAAAAAGRHIFCEKPVAFSARECEQMLRAVDRAGVTFMIGYMKRFDPGCLRGLALFEKMRKRSDVRLIRVHDACFQNDLVIRSMYDLWKYNDAPAGLLRDGEKKMQGRISEALGANAPRAARAAYRLLLETGSHDVNVLRGAFGDPARVLHTEIWPHGNWFASTLDYGGETRCELSIARTARNWADESITAYGMTETVAVEFPNPFHKNAATLVRRTSMKGDATTEETIKASHEEAFKAELKHFFDCARRGKKPLTSLEQGLEDTRLMTSIIKAGMKKK